ncbi:MAG: ribonuclease D [Gammaproteobacteria bacterium]|nr:ribonuclease D [Gammaproteobacteria bacterium]
MTSLVQDDAALRGLCAQLAGAPWIALDTEFMRVKTYRARLCLLQVATPEVVACIDPLAVSIEPLLDVLYDARMLKVLHAARQDLEVFFDIRQTVPTPVFDTQIAAALTGYDDQIGYGALVEKITGHKLPKANQRADWAARPLSPELLAYAADDVRYLRDVYLKLDNELATRGRRAWLDEECVALTEPALYRNDPEQAWQRLKQGKTLNPARQTVLAHLAAWRERVAQQKDLPRGWVVPDSVLAEIARAQPETPEQLAVIPGLEPVLTRRFGAEILETLHAARKLPAQRHWQEPVRPEPEQQRLLDKVSARIQTCASEHGISATLLAPRREMVKFVLGDSDCALLRGWRYQLIGAKLADLRAPLK